MEPTRAKAKRAHRTGRAGERVARRHLRKLGYRIVARNLVVRPDEADIVALDRDGTLVIVEVRTRHASEGGPAPEETVGAHKRRCLVRLAERWRHRAGHGHRPVRFDVIAVELTESRWRPQVELRHYVAAFEG